MDSSKGFSNTSERLSRQIEHILRVWSDRARQVLPAARGQSTLALYDELPIFLKRMAFCLSAPAKVGEVCTGSGTDQNTKEVCKEHGEQRANLANYTLRQVIVEYDLLRQTIFQTLEKEIPLVSEERDLILDVISQGVSEASAEYQRIQDQMREQFIAILTHDLRNPLSAASTSAQLILRKAENPETVTKLGTRITNSLRRVDNMIQDLLDTFQIRAGKPFPIQIEPNEMRSIAKEALEELTTIHGARFILDAPEPVQGYWCSQGIRRSIENLANNAVKYGDGHKTIKISIRQSDDEVMIAVHNHGNPLIAEEQAKLFQPFHRAPFAKTSGRKGWGLGLTLVQGVAHAHGGNVTVQSEPEIGTTFTLKLPKKAKSINPDSRMPEHKGLGI